MWVSLPGKAVMSPRLEQADALLHADVAIGTPRRSLSITAALHFYFSWAQSVARVFVSMATLQSDATKPSQKSPPRVPWHGTRPGNATACSDRLAGRPSEWHLRLSHSASWANALHDPNLPLPSSVGWLQVSTTPHSFNPSMIQLFITHSGSSKMCPEECL